MQGSNGAWNGGWSGGGGRSGGRPDLGAGAGAYVGGGGGGQLANGREYVYTPRGIATPPPPINWGLICNPRGGFGGSRGGGGGRGGGLGGYY